MCARPCPATSAAAEPIQTSSLLYSRCAATRERPPKEESMIDFALSRASTPAQASQQAASAKTAQQGAQVRYIAGGTTLIDLMKLDVETPAQVVDITRLDLARTERQPDGSLRIGAMVRN